MIPGSDYKIELRSRANRYSGTGIAIRFDEASRYPQIASVIPGGPMQRAGGQNNDFIVSVDGRDTQGWSMSQIREVLSGDEGTTVTLELKPGANSTGRIVVVTRGTIAIPALAAFT